MVTGNLKSPQEKNRWPGDPEFWLLICGDMIVFAVIFCVFMWNRTQNVAMFISGSVQLDEVMGLIFTLLMLVSSWFVATALHQARRGRNRAAAVLVLLALTCGLAFCVIKVIDYHTKVSAGFTPATDLFYLYYFSVSGIHLFHVIAAMIALVIVLLKICGAEVKSADMPFIECVAIFWHLTDFLWVMIFALLYLVR